MEQKTKLHAEDGKLDIVITREFDLPLELLFKAHVDPEIVGQVMTSKVVKWESKKNGSYQLEKTDDQGNVVFQAHGVVHELLPNQKIIRTFEMGNTPFGVQLEVYEFERLTDDTSRLRMHLIYESVGQRDQVLKMPFAQGLNWSHNRMEEVMKQLKF